MELALRSQLYCLSLANVARARLVSSRLRAPLPSKASLLVSLFPDVLLWHERGSGSGIVAVFEHNLHGCDIPYFGDRTVLDGFSGTVLPRHIVLADH